MKKTIFLCAILFAIILIGCNEDNLLSNINGLWRVQKYSVDGVDRTRWFDSTYLNFRWSFFTGSKNTFRKSWIAHNTIHSLRYDTTMHVDTMTHIRVIDRIDTVRFIDPYSYSDTLSGDWFLTNSNKFFISRDPIYGTLQYQIIDHSTGSLHLLKGNEDYYLTQ